MKTAQTNVEHPTFETVWAALQEVARIQKENAAEFDLRMKESEAERRKEEAKRREEEAEWRKEETERRKELDKQLGNLSNRFGEMVEHMVVPNLITKFHELGFIFDKAYRNATIKDKVHNIFTEIDITLENGDKVMIVEVKSKLVTDDITDHIKRMQKVKAHADLHGDRRVFLGAVAGIIINESEKEFALKNGFYVIEPSGETFVITEPKGVYSPKEW